VDETMPESPTKADQVAPGRLAGADPVRWGVLIEESLGLWHVDGRVLAGDASVLASVLTPDGERLSIAAAHADENPVRWWLQWHALAAAVGTPTEVIRRKPCASTLGLLRTLRESLGAQAGRRARIAGGAA